jgi:3-isopropylmalate dehydratase small subunit
MKAEFTRDQYNNIWFTNATNIHYRKCTATGFLVKLEHEAREEDKMRRLKEQDTFQLEMELLDFDQEIAETKTDKLPKQRKEMLYDMMDSHYEELRVKLNVD